MYKYLLIAIAASAFGAYAQNAGTFKDSRDGKTYKTVKVGGKTWMAENLNYAADSSKCYGDNAGNCEKYGRLYNWASAMKACPAGYRLPSDGEWTALTNAAGGGSAAGKKLKSASGWNGGGNGTNDYGWSALPGGYGYSDGGFSDAGFSGYWWSATESGALYAWYRNMGYFNGNVEKNDNDEAGLFSVRCVQNTETTAKTAETSDFIEYKSIDVSKFWGNERDFFGKIGSKQQKMGIVFLSTRRISEKEYEVIGKSKVKNNICDFKGIMEVQQIDFESDDPSVVSSIGGKFRFYEDKNQSNTGEFEGEFSISWYENYDIYLDIGSGRPDVYNKDSRLPTVVEFRGTWKGYNSTTKSTVRWGNEEHVFPGSWNDGQEFTLAKNYREIGWGPFFDRKSSDEETRKKAEAEYQKLWVNWWK